MDMQHPPPQETRSRHAPSVEGADLGAVLHSGQNVIATGSAPTMSLTISCQIKICRGYARASLPRTKKITGSRGLSQPSAASTPTNSGLSIARIPSLGGPPDMISDKGTLCFPKSVFHSEVSKGGRSGAVAPGAAGPEIPANRRAPAAKSNNGIRRRLMAAPLWIRRRSSRRFPRETLQSQWVGRPAGGGRASGPGSTSGTRYCR